MCARVCVRVSEREFKVFSSYKTESEDRIHAILKLFFLCSYIFLYLHKKTFSRHIGDVLWINPRICNIGHAHFFPIWVPLWYMVIFLKVKSGCVLPIPISVLPEDIEVTPDSLVLGFNLEVRTCFAIIICGDLSRFRKVS